MGGFLAAALLVTACSSGTASEDGTEGAPGTGGPTDSTEDNVTQAEDWEYDVEFLAGDGTPIEQMTWESLPASDITEDWQICSAIVHLQDPYWLGLDYGLALEAERTGTNFTLLAAGGYTELSTQIDQMDDCVAQGADGIILGATSAEGVVAKAEEIVASGIPVVGIGVPVFSDQVPVAFASFRQLGRVVGEFLVDEVGETDDPVRVAFFPGPEGAGWPDDSLLGFREATEDHGIEVVATPYGDTGREVQLGLVEDTLQAYPDLDFIVGNAVAATVAPQALAETGRDIPVVSTYITPDTYLGVKNGEILGTASDSTAMTGRLGYDMLLRILEGTDFTAEYPAKDVGPQPVLVTPDNLEEFEASRDDHIAPDGFEPVFSMN